ncbi:hypothetical protein QZH41_013992, partial [Actinostola sp. cb2023]
MAGTPGGEESVYDSGRLSLFDLILEKNRAQNKKQLVHRLTHYERLFKNSQAYVHGEAVSGLLLIYPVHVVHVLESSADVLQDVIQDMEEEEQGISGKFFNSKILVYTGDLPNRLFTQWSFRCINQSAARMQEYTTNESINVAVMEALNLLLKLGEYLAKLPKLSLSKTMDQLPEKCPELLVRQDLLEYLINSKYLSTPSQYLKRYTRPLNITLES